MNSHTQQKLVSYVGSFRDIELKLETGFLARQATASVLATYGETVVLASLVIGPQTNLNYLPLQIMYEERLYATGKIKGSRFIKREGKPTDTAVLTGRLVDRSIRSLFNQNIRNDIQIIITVLSVDEVNSPDTVAVLAASAALSLCSFSTADSTITQKELFAGSVGAVRIGLKPQSLGENIIHQIEGLVMTAQNFSELSKPLEEVCSILNSLSHQDQTHIHTIYTILNQKNPQWAQNFRELEKNTPQLSNNQINEKYNLTPEFIVMPSYDQMKLSQLDLVVSGNQSSICMIEAGAQIIAENTLAQALDIAQAQLGTLNTLQQEFVDLYKQTQELKPVIVSLLPSTQSYQDHWQALKPTLEEVIYTSVDKFERDQLTKKFYEEQVVTYSLKDEKFDKNSFYEAYEEVFKSIVQENILRNKRRLDGRNLDQVRQIVCQTSVLPRTHGSSIFQRGETQVLNILTLGTNRDAQTLDEMEDFEEQTKRYIHHYNFPAYSVGEIGRYYGPGRREVGHGALAEKALVPVLPTQESFPYTMRLVSECLGSNGSTSMASVCSSCLSLLDGGVPLKAMVAGIAMGVVIDKKTHDFEILSDIQGSEDHYGDMDFKVAGTDQGVTALQLDNKVQGLGMEVIKSALIKAHAGRMHILEVMKQSLDKPRVDISKYAPRVETVAVPQEKIGEVIGPSGKIIKGLVQRFEVEIDIDDATGMAYIYGKDGEKVKQAKHQIQTIIKGYQIGDIIECKVFRIENYGAFAKIDGTDKEGLIHISEIASRRIDKVEDVLNMHDIVRAKIIDINDQKKISLSVRKLAEA